MSEEKLASLDKQISETQQKLSELFAERRALKQKLAPLTWGQTKALHRREAMSLTREGWSKDQIATKFGVARHTVNEWLKEVAHLEAKEAMQPEPDYRSDNAAWETWYDRVNQERKHIMATLNNHYNTII